MIIDHRERSPLSLAEAAETKDRVRHILQLLRPLERGAISNLYGIPDATYICSEDEVAKLIGKSSISSVRAIHNRSLQRLRQTELSKVLLSLLD
jgi:DNA-directed RNA polymerase sigma subunit (sigma70/sigma32)